MKNERKQKSLKNIVWILIQQVVTAIYGLIAPALIIKYYGSSTNGLISSISQFLSYIALLEAGVGNVITSALYSPLAKKDNNELNKVLTVSANFFKKIAYIFLVYLALIAIGYPFFVKNEFDYFFSFSLVLIISISTFVQYYFGITYQLLIEADQKSWIVAMLQSVTCGLILAVTITSIKLGWSIHIMKIVCAIVYVLRPLLINAYVKKKYKIIPIECDDKNLLHQKWDGLAHHIAYIVHYNTDITVLTIFKGVLEVSVYSVYYNIISNIYKIINSVTAGIKASVGNMLALNEFEKLKRIISEYETINFILTNIMYSCAAILIIPFVKIYTNGVTDANYIRPIFAMILILAEATYGLRNPYDMVIFAAGHFKQTKNGAIMEACINIIISLILVNYIGIIGVAIGTLTAMFVRCCQYVYYLKHNILYRSSLYFWKKLFINILIGFAQVYIGLSVKVSIINYYNWFVYAIVVFAIVATISTLGNYVFFRNDVNALLYTLRIKKHT